MSEIILTEDQQEVSDKLFKFITVDDNDMSLLEGCAGSGKTTLIKTLVQRVLDHAMMSNVAMVAPTHKALKVMREMFPPDVASQVAFSTLHSLLGLKHQINKDGKEIFVRDGKSISKVFMYDLIIVDESSMVADQLFNELMDQNYKNAKILFVGDSNQINPVNHVHSIPMLEEKRKEYKISHFKLTKIIRQAEGNPIIKISQKVLKNEFSFNSGEKDLVDNTGVVMISNRQTAVIDQLLAHYFASEKFDKNADYCKVIAWRNNTVDEYNKTIRKLKYGASSNKIVLGEKLIVDRPIKQDGSDTVLFNTNEDLVVLDIEVKEKTIMGNSFRYYNALVEGDSDQARIHILHEDSESLYKETLDALAKSAKSETDNYKRVTTWRNYYNFIEQFGNVNYNYAITAHCSQGSTYENCFVYYSDIMVNRNQNERRRILYTALTRPKNILYIM